MSGSNKVYEDPKGYNYYNYKQSHQSYSEQLDFVLDKYEMKYGLGNRNQLERSDDYYANNNNIQENNEDESDMRLWEMAKRIKKRNMSFRIVAKILREMQSRQKAPCPFESAKEFTAHPSTNGDNNYNDKHIYTNYRSHSTTSCSSLDDHDNELLESISKCDSNKEIKQEDPTGRNKSDIKPKSVMVVRQTTTRNPIPIVKSKSKISKMTVVSRPMKNPKFPSLDLQKEIPKFIQQEVIDQQMLARGLQVQVQPRNDNCVNNTYKSDDDDEDNVAWTFTWNLLEHAKKVMKVLHIPDNEASKVVEVYSNAQLANHKRKEQFEVNSVLGVEFIPGIQKLFKSTSSK